jgi:hypothetical protein
MPATWGGFSILTILMQAQLLGHAPTTIPPTQCALISWSVYLF